MTASFFLQDEHVARVSSPKTLVSSKHENRLGVEIWWNMRPLQCASMNKTPNERMRFRRSGSKSLKNDKRSLPWLMQTTLFVGGICHSHVTTKQWLTRQATYPLLLSSSPIQATLQHSHVDAVCQQMQPLSQDSNSNINITYCKHFFVPASGYILLHAKQHRPNACCLHATVSITLPGVLISGVSWTFDSVGQQ